MRPVTLRCDALENPLGIDSMRPHLSWQIEASGRDVKQAAYEVLVATRAEALNSGHSDVWSSGRIESRAQGVDYAGPALASGRRYFWTVRVWIEGMSSNASAEPAWWEMGAMSPSDWKARWIAWHDREDIADRAAGVKWIWYSGETDQALSGKLTRYFRYVFQNGSGEKSAVLLVTARDTFTVSANGRELIKSNKYWGGLRAVDVALERGENTILIEAAGSGPHAAVAALLKVGGVRSPTNESWQSAASADGPWKPAAVIASTSDPGQAVDWPARPAALFRKELNIDRPVQSARLRATALGSYRMFINGSRVGDDILTPDWTDYRKRVLYQTYDVTKLVQPGANAIGAMLGAGWYGSALGWHGDRFNFGPPPPRLLAQLEVTYEDGSRAIFGTDGSWKASESPILYSELYAGEYYDARREQPGWDRAGFKDASWSNAEPAAAPAAKMEAQMSPLIRVTQTIRPEKMTPLKPGVIVFDLAQNMVGWVRLKVMGAAGTRVRLRFAERLDADGSIYTDNLRGAEATDTYLLRGGGEETFEPHFTYHGFRYVELTGYPGEPSLDTIAGEVFHTAAPYSGTFTSTNQIANQIWVNTMWGQRGNFESVPTDCPQRDERLGWMGDAGIFWRTGTYNMDLQAFTHKWMRDVVDAQSPGGAFSDVSPRVIDDRDGAPAWGDAGIIVPWEAYRQYGDRRLVEENWPAMERWMNYIHEVNPDLIWAKRRNNDFGDWVPANSSTPKDLIATAYWAQDAKMMADMARGIGRSDDAAKYGRLFDGIREAFIRKFVHDDGTVGNGSQTCYALALHIGLVPDTLRKAAVEHLVDDIRSRNWHLSTGFLGTPHLMFALSENGRADVAYTLLLNDTYPSWGYTIRKGATTIWERWNGDTGDPAMNSYNHYAFGSVVEWLYRVVAGIDTGAASPGFEKIVIHPHPEARLGHARAEYHSIRGLIASEWSLDEKGALSVNVTIPPNTTATIELPGAVGKHVKQDGKSMQLSSAGDAQVGSGSYRFVID